MAGLRRIVLPEPPPAAALAGVPEIFARGAATAVRRALLVGNGAPGAEHQALGLLRALGLGNAFLLQRVTRPRGGIHEFLRWLPLSAHQRLSRAMAAVPWDITQLRILALLRLVPPPPPQLEDSPNIGPPMAALPASAPEANAKKIAEIANEGLSGEGPLLVVASGRDTVATALAIKKLAPDSTFVVQIQHPQCSVKEFDMVITPAHDYHAYTPAAKEEVPETILKWIRPPPPETNVVLTVGALHHADAVALRAAAATWHHQLAFLPRPFVAVNIGGPQRYCRYGDDLIRQLIMALKQVLAFNGGSIRISFSRRTTRSTKELVNTLLGPHPSVYIWDGRGPNPHLGHLAWADAFVVTADSVSMLSEAASTGKPVYVAGDDRCTWKFKEFIGTLKKRGAIRTLTGFENMGDAWSYPPLRDNSEAAARVREAVAAKGWTL